jgi:hypothetical protein
LLGRLDPASDVLLAGQEMQLPAPVKFLYWPAGQAEHEPPMDPKYPIMQAQAAEL